MYQLSRRQLLAAGAGAAALALAGCSSDKQGDTKKGQDLTANKEGAMDSYGVGDQFKATAPLSFSIMMLSNAAYPYNKDWLFFSSWPSGPTSRCSPLWYPAATTTRSAV